MVTPFKYPLQSTDLRLFRGVAMVGLAVLTVWPRAALATQGHSGVEGVWVHQLAHLFFLFAMLLLIYWLRRAGLVREPGWRYIQYAALFFILWNLDAFLVHLLDEQIRAVQVENLGNWEIVVTPHGPAWLAPLYYLIKLDHLLCVPAMVCLWLGLRHMLKKTRPVESAEGAG